MENCEAEPGIVRGNGELWDRIENYGGELEKCGIE
jgi:hypothetical protein